VEAAAQAEVAFEWLTAQIEHVADRLAVLNPFLKKGKGIPLQDVSPLTQPWTLDLPER